MSKYLVVLLLSSSLTFIVGLSSKSQLESESGHAPYNRFTYHLPNDVVPLFYEIDLIVSLHNENLIVRGDSTIKIEVYNETKVISLHYVGYIRNVMIISEIGTPVSVPSKSYIKETETVDLHFENVISPGRYKLVIQYISKSLKSLFKIPYFTNTTESWFIYTVFQPYGARYVFPCWDEPAIEAAFAVKARYQTDDTTDPEAEDWDESKHQLSSFHSLETSKLHIYHVEITLYPSEICLDLRYVPKIKSVIWCREHMNPLFQVAYNTTRSVMKSLSEYTMSQKQLNLDYKVIPGIRKDSIGNWKILIYREGAISYDKDLDPIAQQMEITRLITRTIANLWFHSMVSPFRWKHFWLNEALAAFFQTKVLKDDMLELFLVQTLHESLYLDTNDGEINDNFEMIPLENYMSLEDTLRFSFTISLKAPAIFYMLEHMINPHVFREGLASYFVIHMSTHATSDNLWDAMQLVLNGEHIQLHPHFKLKHVMRTWIRQKHYPIVNVKRNHDHEIVISREPDRLDSTTFTFQKWWIPITFTILKDYNFNNTKPLAWLHPRRSSITLNPIRKSDWIVVNIQQTGYYRVKYERWNWNLIANYLNSEKYIFIHVLNRAKLIDDAYYFMMTHQLDYHIFIKLTSYLSQETDYTAWYPMFKIFEYLSKFLPFSENHRFKTHMRTILDSLFLKIKLLEHPYGSNSINILRHEASKWACVLDNAYCKRAAHIKLQLHLENPEKHKLSPSLKEWTYCNGLPVEDSVTQMKMWTHLIQTTNSHRIIYKYLTCNTKFDNIHMFLKFILNDYTMKYNERINAFYSAIARYAHDYMRIILKDFERYNIHKTEKDKAKTLNIIINHVYAGRKLRKIAMYVVTKFHVDNIKRDIFHILEVRKNIINKHVKTISQLFHIKPTFSDKIDMQVSKYESPKTMSNDVTPLHYDIEVKILNHSSEDTITIIGNYTIKIMIHRETEKIIMHLSNYKVTITTHGISLICETNKSIEYVFSYALLYNGFLVVQFTTVLSPGNYTLHITKLRKVVSETEGSFFKRLYHDKHGHMVWLSATRFKPIGASHIFPCWNDPAFRTTFTISFHHHRTYTVLSNMRRQRIVESHKDSHDHHVVVSHFLPTPPISVNSLVMVIVHKSDYRRNNIERKNIWCKSHLVPYAEYINDVANRVNTYFEYLTETYSEHIPKIDHVIVRGIQEDVIGTFGLIIYNEAAIIYDKEFHTVGRKIQLIPLIARAVARQWFGDVISPSSWSHLWVNDGLAGFFAIQAITEFSPKGKMNKLFAMLIQHESLHLDTNGCMQHLAIHTKQEYEVKSFMSFPIYVKAPAIIRMLQYISSKDIYQFIKIIREYFKVHQLQTVTANDLWAIIDKDNSSKLRDHTNPTYNIPNLKKLMHTWIKEMHYPVLKVIRNYHNNMVMMLQENHNILDRNQWWIPVTYTTQTELEFTDILPKLWLQPGVQNLIIEETVQKNEWIIANLQQAGYYRVNYDPTNWRLIIDYLNHEDYWKIDVLNRAQIIDNAYHLMTIQQLDYDIFLNLTNYLSQEMDYVAWYPMLKILEYLSPFLPLEESTPLKDHMLKILNKILANIKYEELEDEDYFTICLRQELAKWACILDDPYYKQLANTRLTQHLEDPVQNKLLSGWKEWTYCNGLNIASKITWLKFWNAYTKLSNNRMLHIISCSGGFANPNLQLNTKALKHVTKSFRLHECINLFYFVITMNEKDLDSTLANLGNHIVYCKNTSDDIIKVITVIINHLYFEYQLLKVLNFVNCNVNEKRHIAHIKHTILTREYYIKIHKMTFLKIIKNWI